MDGTITAGRRGRRSLSLLSLLLLLAVPLQFLQERLVAPCLEAVGPQGGVGEGTSGGGTILYIVFCVYVSV